MGQDTRGELTREAMDADMGGDKAAPTPTPAPTPVDAESKATPGEGKSGQKVEPKVEPTPEGKPPVTPPAKGEEEPKPTDDKGESGDLKVESEEEKQQKGVNKKIAKEVKKRGAAERKADYEKGRADTLEKQLKEAKDKPLPKLVAPKEEDFDDFDKYTDALVDHKYEVKEREKAEKAKELEKVDTTPDPKPEDIPQLTEEQEETRELMVDSLGEMRAKYKDFDEVAFGVDAEGRHTFPVTESMKEGLESSESRMEILYYLGQNTEEAVKIANLPSTKQVMAIGQLDIKLKNPTTKTKKPPGAPAPIPPVGGVGVPTSGDMSKLSTNDWMAKRNADTGEGRRR